ncbi:MAG: ORF6N domain-containing protein [Burkholderiales bacterium]
MPTWPNYRVETRTLNQAVRRNLDRFPDDFMLQLIWEEARDLRSQNVILSGLGSRAQREKVAAAENREGDLPP